MSEKRLSEIREQLTAIYWELFHCCGYQFERCLTPIGFVIRALGKPLDELACRGER